MAMNWAARLAQLTLSVWTPYLSGMCVYEEQRHDYSFKAEGMQTVELVSVLEKPSDHLGDRTPGPGGRGH